MIAAIFLDVDGCLNDHAWDTETQCGQIHPDKVQRLNHVLRVTNAKIVLSSAWRYFVHRQEMSLRGLEWLLRSHQVLANRLVGITRMDTLVGQLSVVSNERGKQIQDWIDGQTRTSLQVERYVVIDDLDLGISAAGHPFVQTDGDAGLTDDDAVRAIELLQRER